MVGINIEKEWEKHKASKEEIAYKEFPIINSYKDIQQQHRAWLLNYEENFFSIATEGKHQKKWATEKEYYKNSNWNPSINLIQRKKNRTLIEFDGDEKKAKEDLEKTEVKLKELGFGFIRSTHKGKSDYLWIEFNRDMEDKEVEQFLNWIAPKSSEVDLNFMSSNKVFQVLYAVHWRHSFEREMPVEFFKGKQVDYDSLNIPIVKIKKKKVVGEDGFEYTTRRRSVLTRRGQIEEFWKEHPFFYDKSKMFNLWNDKIKKWEISDEIDFLNSIEKSLGVDTINGKTKSEFIAGFQQVGRNHLPKQPEKYWVQFKGKIYNGKTGEFLFDASPDFFIKNPIPYNLGETEGTPTIDKLFCEWVGEKNKLKLYELFSYAMTPDRFMQRIFALCGGGSNGKGTLTHLLIKFLGKENAASSELKELSENQFETAVLFGKLLCVLGEISYDDLKNTNQLKKIAGEDLLRFCFKGKLPFTDVNTALCVCLTNALPTTPDKTIGFYRKWNIIDFPNQFPEIKEDLISQIPEKEFENLALKCFNILKNLYTNPKFTNEGDFEARIKRYEERSNPIMRFVEEFCDEIPSEKISLREFTNACNGFLKEKHLRCLTANQVGKILRNEGFTVGARTIENISSVVILNLKLKKTIETIETIKI